MNFEYLDLKRRERNLTVTKLCELADIDRSTYTRLKESPEALRMSTFRKICDALELTEEEQLAVIN